MADSKEPFQYGPVIETNNDSSDTDSDMDDDGLHNAPFGAFTTLGFPMASPFRRTDSTDSDLDLLQKPLERRSPLAASEPVNPSESSLASQTAMSSSVTPSLSPAEVSEMPDKLIKYAVWSMERSSKSNFLDNEFKRIHYYDARFYACQKSDASKLPENVQKNRYLNVPAYDDWRVKLKENRGVPGSDYINASWITDIEGDEAKEKHRFIATQGPMTDYLQDFWRMIWEQSVVIIVFLGKEIEKGYRKVDRYWPDGDSKNSLSQNPWDKNRYDSFFPMFNQPEVHKKNMVLPPFTVEAIKEEVVQECEIVKRTFHLYNSNFPGEVREIYQFQYGGWPDQGAPSSSHDIRTLINEVRVLHDMDKVPRPIVVHCSAGIGRTGAFCTIYVYMQNILMYMDRMRKRDKLEEVLEQSRLKAKANDPECHDRDYGPDVLTFNISATVLSLRKHRIGMVQNPDQYKFCYKAIVDELRHQRFLPPLDDLPEPTFESEAKSSNTVIPVMFSNSVIPVYGGDSDYVEDVEKTKLRSSSSLLSSSGFGSLSVSSQIKQLSKNPKPSEKTFTRPPSMTSFTGNPLLSGSRSSGVRGNPCFPPLGGSMFSDDDDNFQLNQSFGRSPPLGFSGVSTQVSLSRPVHVSPTPGGSSSHSGGSSSHFAGDLACMGDDDDDDDVPDGTNAPKSFSELARISSSTTEFK